jgi:DNA-binding MarR family transcriptional regulator
VPRPRNPVDTLATVAPLATRWIERLLGELEPSLTVAQFLALRAIAREPLLGAELARRAGVSGAAVSQLVASLEQSGWVERKPEPLDRRRHTLRLSRTGAEALAAASALLRQRLGPLLAGLPKPELHALSGLLEQLEAALAGTAPPRRPHRPEGPPPRRR